MPERLAYQLLTSGDPAPWFNQKTGSKLDFSFSSMAGRYIILCFFGSVHAAQSGNIFAAINRNRSVLDDERICFFGVSAEPSDVARPELQDDLPGIRFFYDFDFKVSALYGSAPIKISTKSVPLRRFWVVLDPTLRVMRTFGITANNSGADDVFAYLQTLPDPENFAGFEVPAPILVIPDAFEGSFCEKLISDYTAACRNETGVMREASGKTVMVVDPAFKRRRDFIIENSETIIEVQKRIQRRVATEIAKIYAFNVTRMERYLVGCYAAEDNAYFRPHRDNTTRGTAHRRFAVSINLNSDFEGGELSFPEYGRRSYKVRPGTAIVFPCALLHAVSMVTKGRRYAFLPFLYDDAAAKLREENRRYLQAGGLETLSS